MDLVVFEKNKPFVMDEFREGRFDYVELDAALRGLQRPQPVSAADALRSRLPSQAGPRHRTGKTGRLVRFHSRASTRATSMPTDMKTAGCW